MAKRVTKRPDKRSPSRPTHLCSEEEGGLPREIVDGSLQAAGLHLISGSEQQEKSAYRIKTARLAPLKLDIDDIGDCISDCEGEDWH